MLVDRGLGRSRLSIGYSSSYSIRAQLQALGVRLGYPVWPAPGYAGASGRIWGPKKGPVPMREKLPAISSRAGRRDSGVSRGEMPDLVEETVGRKEGQASYV